MVLLGSDLAWCSTHRQSDPVFLSVPGLDCPALAAHRRWHYVSTQELAANRVAGVGPGQALADGECGREALKCSGEIALGLQHTADLAVRN